jgi:hypothetical protein
VWVTFASGNVVARTERAACWGSASPSAKDRQADLLHLGMAGAAVTFASDVITALREFERELTKCQLVFHDLTDRERKLLEDAARRFANEAKMAFLSQRVNAELRRLGLG